MIISTTGITDMTAANDDFYDANRDSTIFDAMVVTDFDGTLRHSGQPISAADLDALHELGERRCLRVIATGRSLFSFNSTGEKDLPVDFIIFSSGSGILDYRSNTIVKKSCLTSAEVSKAAGLLMSLGHDFMIHHPIPDNHRFLFWQADRGNNDFATRLKRYSDFAKPFDGKSESLGPGTQLLVIHPGNYSQIDSTEAHLNIKRRLPDFSVIRATSPLDGESTWIEIFPKGVSKSTTAAWLARKFDIRHVNTFALGNDYNDLDLLEWAASRFIMQNAPPELKTRFQVVGPECGFSEAVSRWLNKEGGKEGDKK